MQVGESWTNAHGETVTVTERGLKVTKRAHNAAAPRTMPSAPVKPVAARPAPVVQELPFIAPVPYWKPKK